MSACHYTQEAHPREWQELFEFSRQGFFSVRFSEYQTMYRGYLVSEQIDHEVYFGFAIENKNTNTKSIRSCSSDARWQDTLCNQMPYSRIVWACIWKYVLQYFFENDHITLPSQFSLADTFKCHYIIDNNAIYLVRYCTNYA